MSEMSGIRDIMLELSNAEPGYHVFREVGDITVMMLAGAGFVKVDIVDHLPNVYQIRITGAGRDFVARMVAIEQHVASDPNLHPEDVVKELRDTVNEHFDIREMDPDGG